MDHLACVDVPALPLQILLREHADWKDKPVGVVDKDSPQGVLLWVNEKALQLRVLPGLRYATGLSITSELRAGVVADSVIQSWVAQLAKTLQCFTPEVEVAKELPGVFWLNASGLNRLYASLQDWTHQLQKRIRQQGFFCSVVVGVTRFGTYAAAKARHHAMVFGNVDDERKFVHKVPLSRLDFPPKLRDSLARLGAVTIGDFLQLPRKQLSHRLGAEAFYLYQLAEDQVWQQWRPVAAKEPLLERVVLDFGLRRVDSLIRLVCRSLDRLLEELAQRRQALTEILVKWKWERGETHTESIRTAKPTLDRKVLQNLVKLRLEKTQFACCIEELLVRVDGTAVSKEQLRLFRENPKRNPKAAERAFARICAELGADSVRRATLCDGHLPFATFVWEPLRTLSYPKPKQSTIPFLVRSIYGQAQPLSSMPRHGRDDGWLIHDLELGPVVRRVGPYRISGGWWAREVERHYYFVETRSGHWLWVYYDKKRRRWFLEGQVE